MATRLKYRPAAPGDRFGHVCLTDDELLNPELLSQEARAYAEQFMKHDNEFGLPAVVVTALAVGLVRGAKAFEEGASDAALKYVSALLTGGGLTNFGKVGATLVPAIFDRVFGTRPLSIKFILRSFLATTLFWIILLAVRHPNWGYVWQKLIYGNSNSTLPHTIMVLCGFVFVGESEIVAEIDLRKIHID